MIYQNNMFYFLILSWPLVRDATLEILNGFMFNFAVFIFESTSSVFMIVISAHSSVSFFKFLEKKC